ncbi:MAG: hypothetical protein FJW14_01000 [Acidimicrobiia bacterium]|nr:hypothetical protein [Acidimicrobiia bacterium]
MTQFRAVQFRTSQAPTGRVIRTIDLDTATGHDIARLVAGVDTADLVVMIVAAGSDAHAAAIIGEACSARRVMTHTIIVRASAVSDAALSRTLAQVRPWSLMVVVTNDDDYVDDILRSFR